MAERVSEVSEGLVTKRLAWEEYGGDTSLVARITYQNFLERAANGLPGSPQEDWQSAEEMARRKFRRELARTSSF